jgi:predicted TIM-barrel fold metal-dependent hydrolase
MPPRRGQPTSGSTARDTVVEARRTRIDRRAGVGSRGGTVERKLITADCHIAPPFSLVDELPESDRAYFPRLDRRGDGAYVLWHRPVPMGMTTADPMAIRIDDTPRAQARAAVANVCPEAHPSFDAAEHLAELERDGVFGAVLIGRISVLHGNTPPSVDAAYCRLVNDWLAETWGPYLDRVAPGIYLPFKDVAASVKELERAAALGLRPALLPDGIFERPYHLAEWEPLWEAADGLNIPITMHVSDLRKAPHKDPDPYPGRSFTNFYNAAVGMGETLGWLVFSGVFARYPHLHVIMTEGYAAWLAFAIQFFDHHWNDTRFPALTMNMDASEYPHLDEPPGVYLKRQAHATFMWDPLAVRARDVTGLDSLLWGNDYPHHEGSFPASRQWIEKQFAGVPEAEVDAIVRGNAARLFGLEA